MYQIKLLSDAEFDALPYKHVKAAAGCADPKTNTAYVRSSMTKNMQLLTIDHELQELASQFSDHEVDGIRYGWFHKIFGFSSQPIVNVAAPILAAMIPGVGPLLSAALAAGTSALTQKLNTGRIDPMQVGLSAIGGGILKAGMMPGIAASKAAGGGMFGQTLTGLKSAVGMSVANTGANTIRGGTLLSQAANTGNVPGTAVNFGGSTFNLSGGASGLSATGVGVAPTSTALNSSALWQQNMGGSIAPNAPVAMTPTQAIAASNVPGGLSGANTGLGLDFLKSPAAKLGVGLMGLSGLTTSTTPPDVGPVISKWLTTDTITKAGARAREIADTEYAGTWNPDKETSAYIDVMEKDIRKSYKTRAEEMDKMASNVNENWARSGERLEMMKKLGDEEQREVDTMRSEWLLTSKKQYAQNQYNYVMEGLKVDDVTKRDLLYGELQDIMWKYNVAEQDIMNFRKIASDAGMYMIQKGMGG